MTVANSGTVEIEVEGKIYKGTYTVWKGLVTVEYEEKSKSTQVGGSTPAGIARLLLREIIEGI